MVADAGKDAWKERWGTALGIAGQGIIVEVRRCKTAVRDKLLRARAFLSKENMVELKRELKQELLNALEIPNILVTLVPPLNCPSRDASRVLPLPFIVCHHH